MDQTATQFAIRTDVLVIIGNFSFFLLIFHALFLLQLLQRFRLEYHHEPLEMRQKLLTAPDKPVKIKFVDRVWESRLPMCSYRLMADFFNVIK